jgi:hypothetical protein
MWDRFASTGVAAWADLRAQSSAKIAKVHPDRRSQRLHMPQLEQ